MNKKTMICIIVVFLVCLCLTACSGGALKLEDFGVYENGKTVLTSSDIMGDEYDGMVFFGSLQEYDFPGQVLETKRGAKLGSTAAEVASAYKGVETPLLGPDPMTLEDFLADSELHAAGQDYMAAYFLESGGKTYSLNISFVDDIVDSIGIVIL